MAVRLGDILVSHGFVAEPTLQAAIQAKPQGIMLGDWVDSAESHHPPPTWQSP